MKHHLFFATLWLYPPLCLSFNQQDKQTIESHLKAPIASITSLKGGNSNTALYKIDTKLKSYVLRYLAGSTALKKNECNAQLYASCYKYGPNITLCDQDMKYLLMDYIEPTFKTTEWIKRPSIQRNLIVKIKQLHAKKITPTDTVFNPFDHLRDFITKVEHHLDSLDKKPTFLEHIRYASLRNSIDTLETTLACMPDTVVCHNDLTPNNILLQNTHPYIIDYENSGINDRYFDLCTLCTQAGFTKSETYDFFKDYFGRTITKKEKVKIRIMNHVVFLYYGMAYCRPLLFHKNIDLITTDTFFKQLQEIVPDYHSCMSTQTPYHAIASSYALDSLFSLFVLGSNMLAHFYEYIQSETFEKDFNSIAT